MWGAVIWLTGLPCAGKTTIAERLARELQETGQAVEHLDGDVMRSTPGFSAGFSSKERTGHVARMAFIAELLSRNGITVVASFVSPARKARDSIRQRIPSFVEVFVDCPRGVCEQRDCKGLYARARAGKILRFTGVSAPFEPPAHPEVHVHTDSQSIEECVAAIRAYLAQHPPSKK